LRTGTLLVDVGKKSSKMSYVKARCPRQLTEICVETRLPHNKEALALMMLGFVT
jgi:hypothetical protein